MLDVFENIPDVYSMEYQFKKINLKDLISTFALHNIMFTMHGSNVLTLGSTQITEICYDGILYECKCKLSSKLFLQDGGVCLTATSISKSLIRSVTDEFYLVKTISRALSYGQLNSAIYSITTLASVEFCDNSEFLIKLNEIHNGRI